MHAILNSVDNMKCLAVIFRRDKVCVFSYIVTDWVVAFPAASYWHLLEEKNTSCLIFLPDLWRISEPIFDPKESIITCVNVELVDIGLSLSRSSCRPRQLYSITRTWSLSHSCTFRLFVMKRQYVFRCIANYRSLLSTLHCRVNVLLRCTMVVTL